MYKHLVTIFECLLLYRNNKIDFVENLLCIKLSVYLNLYLFLTIILKKFLGFSFQNPHNYQVDPILYQKPSSKFNIDSFFNYIGIVPTDQKHIIVKSIHLSLCSESKS